PTVPMRADLLTGQFTFTYLPWGPLPQSEITLAQNLSQAGYATVAIGDTPFLSRRGYGYDRGFQEFIYVRGQFDGTEREFRHLHRPVSEEMGYCAAKTFKEAGDWLYQHHEEKFFMYIDTWDPHEPWDPPAHYIKPYLPDYKGEIVNPNYWDYKEDGYTERDMEIARACYKGEISMVDHWFGYLMERLRVQNLFEDTAIIFTSDHGFYFGEHGLFGKRRFQWSDGTKFEDGFAKGLTVSDQIVFSSPLHQEVTKVPLLMHLPGQESKRISGLVSAPDLNPTILELAGADLVESIQAKSILPLVRKETDSIHDFVVTSAPFEEVGQLSKTVDDAAREVIEISPSTITDGEWDLLFGVQGQPVELYRTKDDPGHQKNVYQEFPEVVEELHKKFVIWLEEMGTSSKYLDPRRNI
ncbi:MAG: sulfatase, partial [Pelolinea sp.]|nr:sulfatase [Pelolinea sp.]